MDWQIGALHGGGAAGSAVVGQQGIGNHGAFCSILLPRGPAL